MGFNMPKKHVLAISAVVVVAVAAAWLMPGRSKAPSTAGAPANEQAQLPLGQTPQPNSNGSPAVEFAGSSQPMPLPLVGQSQPVMRGPLAEAAGGITEGDDGVPVEGSSATPPTVTTIAPPAGCRLARRRPLRLVRPQHRPRSLPPSRLRWSSLLLLRSASRLHRPPNQPKPVTVAKAATGGSWYAGQAPGNYVVQILAPVPRPRRRTSSRSRALSTVISRKSSTANRCM